MDADTPIWLQRVRAGEPFEMPDFDFIGAVMAAAARTQAFGSTNFDSLEAAQEALTGILGSIGTETVVRAPLTVDVGFNIEIGSGSFLNANATLLDTYPIRIGNDVQIGPNCALYPVAHPLRESDRILRDGEGHKKGHITQGAPIVIEDGVWLGGNVVVLAGVTIGARSAIGAGSVVTRSVPPDVFAAGNPCRVIRDL